METKQKDRHKLTAAGVLITMGVVYGDIGTSPLYVMKSIVEGNGGLASVSPDFIIGSISLIFWTLTLLTSIKYVMIALRADNEGEGGIFALYTLVRKRAKWLIIPAMLGGATLLADGMLTPAVTVTTAIEGLRNLEFFGITPITTQKEVIAFTVIILTLLFFIQRFGTAMIGKAFGPIMFLWFTFIGLLGFVNMLGDLSILRAFNPYYAIKVLLSPQNKAGLFILGSVFLATTGAEALYSDLGHVGRNNIYFSWPYIKICLVLNYFGQGVWLIQNQNNKALQNLTDFNPFFLIMPDWLHLIGVIFATLAAVIASQALISGSFTLVSEAIKLKLLPRLRIIYPTNTRGQLYMPAINTVLWVVCIAVVFYFQTSSHMEAAYGLAITITMLMTTVLLSQYLMMKKVPVVISYGILLFFGGLETFFFISSAAKFMHGGYVTVLIALLILSIMVIWRVGVIIKNDHIHYSNHVSLLAYKRQLQELSHDEEYPTFATNLVYVSKVHPGNMIKKEILYSILDKRPKRAQVYWFVTVNVTDEPYTATYTADTFGTDYMVNVQLYLGFRMEQKVNVFLRQVVSELMRDGKIPKQPQKYTTIPNRQVGDFSFVIIQEDLSPKTQLKGIAKTIMMLRLLIQNVTLSPSSWYGLEYSETIVEHVPLILGERPKFRGALHRKNKTQN